MWNVFYKEENGIETKRRMVLSEGELEKTLEELNMRGCTEIDIKEFGKKAKIKLDLNNPSQRECKPWKL